MIKIIFFILIYFTNSFASLSGASAIYPEYKDKVEGVYEDKLSNILFILVDLPIDKSKRYKKSIYEAKAMLKYKDLLKDYLGIKDKIIKKDNIPFNDKLQDDIYKKALMYERYKFKVDNIKAKIFKNSKVQDRYKYILAIDKTNIKLTIKTTNDINSIKKATKTIILNSLKTPSLASSYFKDMGIYELEYIYKKIELSKKYNLVNIFDITSTQIYVYNYIFTKILNGDLDTSFLNYVPANKQILDSLDKSTTSKIEKDIFKNTSMFNNDQYFNKSIFELSIVGGGHLEFSKNLSNKKTNEFIKAKQYFIKGIHIDEIIKLLKISINKSPRFIDNWYYISSVLKAKGDLKGAESCLIQALQLNPKNIKVLKDLVKIFKITDKNKYDKYNLYLSILKQ